MIANIQGVKSCFAHIMHSSGTSLILFKQLKHVCAAVPALGWPFLTFVVTRVNMRDVFYYKLS
jgi:hypothetical protein